MKNESFDAGLAMSALLDNEISDEQFAELQQLLRDDPHVRDEFAQQIQIHTLLESHYSELRGKGNSAVALPSLDYPTNFDASQTTHT